MMSPTPLHASLPSQLCLQENFPWSTARICALLVTIISILTNSILLSYVTCHYLLPIQLSFSYLRVSLPSAPKYFQASAILENPSLTLDALALSFSCTFPRDLATFHLPLTPQPFKATHALCGLNTMICTLAWLGSWSCHCVAWQLGHA